MLPAELYDASQSLDDHKSVSEVGRFLKTCASGNNNAALLFAGFLNLSLMLQPRGVNAGLRLSATSPTACTSFSMSETKTLIC